MHRGTRCRVGNTWRDAPWPETPAQNGTDAMLERSALTPAWSRTVSSASADLHGFRVLQASGGFAQIPMLSLKSFAAVLKPLVLRADQPLDTHLIHFGCR
jgi:hypothetical protein